jgi:hypothetical protein|tara:strand:- start:264 stop:761 length:498 start_codon:yes stop_codon:yes gene_type:complete
MRIIFLSITLLAFSCSCNNNSSASFLSGIEISNAEIEEVKNTEEISEYILPHFNDIDFSNALLDDNSLANMDELIELCIKLEKSSLNLKEIEASKELFSIQLDKTMDDANAIGGQAQAFFNEYLETLHSLVDMTFDVQKEEEFKTGLNNIKVYLGNFYNFFPIRE